MRAALRQLISDGTGAISTTRVTTLAIVGTVLVIWVAQNVAAIIAHQGFVDMGINCVAVIGVAITGKIVQNYTEPRAVALPKETDDPCVFPE